MLTTTLLYWVSSYKWADSRKIWRNFVAHFWKCQFEGYQIWLVCSDLFSADAADIDSSGQLTGLPNVNSSSLILVFCFDFGSFLKKRDTMWENDRHSVQRLDLTQYLIVGSLLRGGGYAKKDLSSHNESLSSTSFQLTMVPPFHLSFLHCQRMYFFVCWTSKDWRRLRYTISNRLAANRRCQRCFEKSFRCLPD